MSSPTAPHSSAGRLTGFLLLIMVHASLLHGAAAARTASAVAAGAAAAAKQAAAAAAAAAGAAAEPTAAEPAAAAGSTTPEFAWFEQHVASKCFAPPDATWKLDEAAKETVLLRQTQFFGVYDQPEGFYYHYSTTSKQTEYSVVGGIRTQAAKPLRHSTAYRCQYGVRRSTKAIFGICYPADATGVPTVDTAVPWPFTVYATTLKLTDASTLTQTFSTLPAYEDLLAASPSGVKPGRQETVITYSLDVATGKVSMATKVSAFDVDTDSLEPRYVGSQEPGVETQVPCAYRRRHR